MDTKADRLTERVNVRVTTSIKLKLATWAKELGLPERELVRSILAKATREWEARRETLP